MSTGSWAGIREQIQELAKAPGARAVFGFHGHKFGLEDPLSELELDVDGDGVIQGEPIRLRTGLASPKSVRAAVDAV